jgi:glycosyltransferase involved in cell wall biosynthesis
MKVSVVVPLYNEQESLEELTGKIGDSLNPPGHAWEVVFIDDGSSDGSYDVIRKLHAADPNHVKAIRFARNYGKAAALSVGFEQAAGDVIVTMDADLQDDPAAIPEMLAKLDEGYDLVSGWKKKRHDPLEKRLPSKLFNLVVSVMSGIRLHDFNCGFKAYRAHVAKGLEVYGERHRFLPALAHWDRFRVTEMVVTHHARKHGKSKYGLSRYYKGMLDLVTLVFLRKYLKNPLHFFGLFGLLFMVLGGGVLGYFGVEWIVTRHMHLRPLVLLSIGSVIMGIQFVSIGLLGEMISHAAPKNTYKVRETLS